MTTLASPLPTVSSDYLDTDAAPQVSKDSVILLQKLEERLPLAVPVPHITRDVQVTIASNRHEWHEAYELVARNYRAHGYEASNSGTVRFTPYHALPDTVTFVAKHEGHVVATLSLVPDNTLLGLPMQCVFDAEIQELRRSGLRLAEVTSLADSNLGTREFVNVFCALIKLMSQYLVSQGGDPVVIGVNPRHRNFYVKVMGFEPLGSCRAYPLVQGAPAEPYIIDRQRMKTNAPKTYEYVFGEWLPRQAFVAPRMPPGLLYYFASRSTQRCTEMVRQVIERESAKVKLRRW